MSNDLIYINDSNFYKFSWHINPMKSQQDIQGDSRYPKYPNFRGLIFQYSNFRGLISKYFNFHFHETRIAGQNRNIPKFTFQFQRVNIQIYPRKYDWYPSIPIWANTPLSFRKLPVYMLRPKIYVTLLVTILIQLILLNNFFYCRVWKSNHEGFHYFFVDLS